MTQESSAETVSWSAYPGPLSVAWTSRHDGPRSVSSVHGDSEAQGQCSSCRNHLCCTLLWKQCKPPRFKWCVHGIPPVNRRSVKEFVSCSKTTAEAQLCLVSACTSGAARKVQRSFYRGGKGPKSCKLTFPCHPLADSGSHGCGHSPLEGRPGE